MRKNFSDVAFYPQPVLVIATYDENGVPNAMNVAWGGLCGSKYVDINISRGHKTTENILLKKAFTMSFADRPTWWRPTTSAWSPATRRTRSKRQGCTR